jgi:hypothetical protein
LFEEKFAVRRADYGFALNEVFVVSSPLLGRLGQFSMCIHFADGRQEICTAVAKTSCVRN